MISRSALVWDSKIVFARYIEECGVTCEHLTPHMLAAPFYRGRFVALIIPTGFAHSSYSGLLPALRAASPRIRKYIEHGGRLLVFGAACDRSDAYDWLPFEVTYHHCYGSGSIEMKQGSPLTAMLEDYDPGCIECDGYFGDHSGIEIASSGGRPVLIGKRIGEGEIIVTTIHEYPSRSFVKTFCSAPGETLF